jgi:hypothetical protein
MSNPKSEETMEALIQNYFPEAQYTVPSTVLTHCQNTSWQNDAAPSFGITDRYRLWVDHADTTEREMCSFRFCLSCEDCFEIDIFACETIEEMVRFMLYMFDLFQTTGHEVDMTDLVAHTKVLDMQLDLNIVQRRITLSNELTA